jgi:imidazolonepropionase-like amidohydrolase
VIALQGGRVVAEPYEDPFPATVLIEDGKIVAVASSLEIPAEVQIVDCTQCTIVAGFWNAHVHFFERKWKDAAQIPSDELNAQLDDFSTFGFTSVIDLSSAFENTSAIRNRIDSGNVLGPRIRTTGPGIVPSGFDLPDAVIAVLGQMKVPLPQVSDPQEAADAVRSLLAIGVDGIKLFASIPSGAMLSFETMRAAVDEAHRAGAPVFVHPNTADDIERAVEAGVDVVAHTTPRSGAWSDELIDRMRSRNVALIPTLALWSDFARHDRRSVQQRQVQTAVGQLAAWRARGGAILFGTDFGAVGPDPAREFALMREAGMDVREILASLTTVPASRFGCADRLGKIAPGFEADITVIEGDPLRNVDTLRNVRFVLDSTNSQQVPP